ncbi:N-acetylneuraminate synthase family protein [Roseisolibacter agri]|uniref:Acetylneuraminic acid synthetase n=1 Tax=Roseisolibacter agri TaxID=2014610 RepID=A0AA37VBP5_9BACT|nr:N-acetylneuraminate synthase family protein [Roseisolibacter agri]GLC26698.1 acetylneuraminic acid synthetase [Roseisolibacter agri]
MSAESRHVRIGDRRVGPGEPCYVIAEVGVNHNGDLGIAKRLVDAAIAAGADAVKFQKRRLREVYQERIVDEPRLGEQGIQYVVPLLIEFELSDEAFRALHAYCAERGITFLCTPWDTSSADFLDALGVPAFKVGSPDMTNFPLLDHLAALGKPLLVSTGMSTEDEIRRTITFLEDRRADYALFHAVSTYPAAPEELNLRFMSVLHEWSGGRPVGYSGHDTGISASVAAVSLGAHLIERHITLDRAMRGSDHHASLEPSTFAAQVAAIRDTEASLGVAHRWITRGELLNRRVLGKSLVATRDIPAGVEVTRAMVTSKSPGMGLSPQHLDQLVGRRLTRAVARDDMFLDDDLLDAGLPASVCGPIDLGVPWGIVARFNDLDGLMARFANAGLSFVEFHVSDRDLDAGPDELPQVQRPYGLVVHAPEYMHDRLIDLCAVDADQREASIHRIQKTIDFTRRLARLFAPTFERGPKIVMHVGGMSPVAEGYDTQGATERLLHSLRRLDHDGVDLLLENLAPFPWFFGGKWFGHVLTNADSAEYLCRESGLGFCFDTSHAGMECNRSGASLTEFAQRVAPYTRHLHVSDAAGTGGEGLQIGEGDVNFAEVLPPVLSRAPSVVPEIWMGHHQRGKGFQVALESLADLLWASRALARATDRGRRPATDLVRIPEGASILGALRVIDANALGIGFVVDAKGVLLGVVTDGDIRHGLVRRRTLTGPVADIMTRHYVYATVDMAPEQIRASLHGRTRVVPILDADNRLIDYATDAWVPDYRNAGPASPTVTAPR